MTHEYGKSKSRVKSGEISTQFEIRSFWHPYIPWFAYGCVIGTILFGMYLWMKPHDIADVPTSSIAASEAADRHALNTAHSSDNLGQMDDASASLSTATSAPGASAPTLASAPVADPAPALQTADSAAAAAQKPAQKTADQHPTFDFYTVLPEGEGNKLTKNLEDTPEHPAEDAASLSANTALGTAPVAPTATTPEKLSATRERESVAATAPTPTVATTTATVTTAAPTTAMAETVATATAGVRPRKTPAAVSKTQAATTKATAQAQANATSKAVAIAKLRKQIELAAAAKRAAPPVYPDAPAIAGKKVMLQIASFSSSKDAEQLRAALLLRGYAPKIHHVEDAQNLRTLHRVFLGPYELTQAQKHCASVRALGYDCLVVTRILG